MGESLDVCVTNVCLLTRTAKWDALSLKVGVPEFMNDAVRPGLGASDGCAANARRDASQRNTMRPNERRLYDATHTPARRVQPPPTAVHRLPPQHRADFFQGFGRIASPEDRRALHTLPRRDSVGRGSWVSRCMAHATRASLGRHCRAGTARMWFLGARPGGLPSPAMVARLLRGNRLRALVSGPDRVPRSQAAVVHGQCLLMGHAGSTVGSKPADQPNGGSGRQGDRGSCTCWRRIRTRPV